MPKKLKIKIDGIVSGSDIPNDVEELELECKEIADLAFKRRKKLRSLTLINVKRIGEQAFFKCLGLESVKLINCEVIGKGAFSQCKKLTYANLDCKEIAELSFYKCDGLKRVTLLNTEVIGYRAFFDCFIDEIKLPDTLREFGLDAFRYGNEELYVKNWEIPSSFKSTKKLKIKIDGIVRKGDIPDDIEELELECDEVDCFAFYKNKSLRILKLINVKKIRSSAFFDCKKLISLEIVNCGEIRPSAFEKSRALLKLRLADVEIIGERSFIDCKSLSSAELVNCGELGRIAFRYCIGLKRAVSDCKIIGEYAFSFCKHLENVTLHNTEVIGKEAFYLNLIKKIELPETLISIGDCAFANSKIKHLVIPPSVTELGNEIIPGGNGSLSVIEIYIKDGKAAFFSPDKLHKEPYAKLVVRSAETGEAIYRFMALDNLEEVLTDHGADFTEYDKTLLEGWASAAWLDAARMRIKDPANMSEETFENLKDHISETTAKRLKEMMDKSCSYKLLYPEKDFADFSDYDDLKVKNILELISYSGTKGLRDVTKILTKLLYKKLEGINDINVREFMEGAEISARLGLTEITALLMQKLDEIGGGHRPELEL